MASKLLVLFLLLFFTSCMTTSTQFSMNMPTIGSQPSHMLTGSIYAYNKGTLSVTELAGDEKQGSARTESFFGMIALGDSSIARAMYNGRVRHVKTVDYTIYRINLSAFVVHFPIYERFETNVYGE